MVVERAFNGKHNNTVSLMFHHIEATFLADIRTSMLCVCCIPVSYTIPSSNSLSSFLSLRGEVCVFIGLPSGVYVICLVVKYIEDGYD